VLAALSLPRHDRLSLRKLAEVLSIPRSTLHRILLTLEAKGVLEHVPDQGYVLGPGALELSLGYRRQQLHLLAAPIMQVLRSELGETVNVAIPSGHAMLVVAAVESPQRLRTVSWMGQRNEFHASALGKSYLAALSGADLDRSLRRLKLTPLTRRTITSITRLEKEIDTTKARGFAIDDGESVDGTRCAGAAIIADGERPVGAVSVSAPTARVSVRALKEIGGVVAEAAQDISGLMSSPRASSDRGAPVTTAEGGGL
jgi:IclR family acetate operon transcriptional repressor